MRQLVLDIRPGAPKQLERFIVGANAEVLHILQQWLTHPQAEPFVYLWGEPGCGKSHLLQALVPQRYYRCHKTMILEPDPDPLLALDDVHLLSPAGAFSLFHRFNERRDTEKRLLTTGPCPPAQLPLPAEVRTRLGWGLVLRLQGLDDLQKQQALQSHAAQLGAHLPEESARYILTHWSRDMTSLFELVQELDRWSVSVHRPVITIPLIRDALASLNPDIPTNPDTTSTVPLMSIDHQPDPKPHD